LGGRKYSKKGRQKDRKDTGRGRRAGARDLDICNGLRSTPYKRKEKVLAKRKGIQRKEMKEKTRENQRGLRF